jgi:transcriptional regulator with XRE-family HTH domain
MGRRRKDNDNEHIRFALIFGRVLRELRTLKNLSLHQLSDKCGVDVTTICRYEHGATIPVALSVLSDKEIDELGKKARTPDILRAHKILSALGVSLDAAIKKCLDYLEEP